MSLSGGPRQAPEETLHLVREDRGSSTRCSVLQGTQVKWRSETPLLSAYDLNPEGALVGLGEASLHFGATSIPTRVLFTVDASGCIKSLEAYLPSGEEQPHGRVYPQVLDVLALRDSAAVRLVRSPDLLQEVQSYSFVNGRKGASFHPAEQVQAAFQTPDFLMVVEMTGVPGTNALFLIGMRTCDPGVRPSWAALLTLEGDVLWKSRPAEGTFVLPATTSTGEGTGVVHVDWADKNGAVRPQALRVTRDEHDVVTIDGKGWSVAEQEGMK